MATPTPGKHVPQVVATPPVSTPFSHHNLGFSPHGPKSVQPSPQHIKKSPANSNTLYAYPSANHPTNSSYGAGYDSPSAAMALGGVVGLGELGIDGMGVGLGGLGGTRGDDQDRSRKMAAVVDILKANKGRLSEAGMERLARKVGLDGLWEAHMGSGSGARTFIIAGKALALDIDFNNNVVQKVSLVLEASDIVMKHTEKAGAILLEDLQVKPTESPLTKMLDRFAANLERLALLDKLSVLPTLNCYEAVAGLYESLERLHNWEVEKLGESEDFKGKGQDAVSRAALCTKSGKPLMHTRGRLGLSLDYWEEKRQILKKSSTQQTKTWSLVIECAPIPLQMLERGMSLRVSTNWISNEIEKTMSPGEEMFLAPGNEPILDWQNPEYTMLPSTEPPRSGVMNSIEQALGQKYPDVMFLAKFDPPVTLPFGLASQFMVSCTNEHLDEFQAVRFDELLFPHKPGVKIENEDSSRKISHEVLVPVFSNAVETTQRHKNTLSIDKIDFGKTFTEIPFCHPTQLISMLPVLRQYAFLSTLLGKSFGSTASVAPAVDTNQPSRSKAEELQEIISGRPLSTVKGQAVPIDVTLSTTPSIQSSVKLGLTFPFKNRTANINFEIGPNAVVKVTGENTVAVLNESEGKKVTAQDLARMLEITEDLGIWVEFVRRRLV